MRLTVIVNSVMWMVRGTIVVLVAGGSIVSIDNMKAPWVRGLLVAALLLPVTFLVSGIGA